MSKRVKINFNNINGDNWKKLDVGDFNTRLKERQKLERESKQKEKEKEVERIKTIKCPACKSTNKHHHQKYGSNGIMGPGRTSWLVEDYLICLDCGIHFNDVNKGK